MIGKPTISSINVLLVEDNQDDIILTQEAFSEARIHLNLYTSRDGVQALEFLNNPNNPKPDLILLDLNMPRKDGRETLEEIKAHPQFKRIPVIILTTSEAEKDIISAYDKNANSYIVKPVSFDQFIEVVQALEEFWFSIVKLPSENQS